MKMKEQSKQEDLANTIEADLKNPALMLIYEFAQRVQAGEIPNIIVIGYSLPEKPSEDCQAVITSGFVCTNNHARTHLIETVQTILNDLKQKEVTLLLNAILPNYLRKGGGH